MNSRHRFRNEPRLLLASALGLLLVLGFPTPARAQEVSVVATTAWTAAFAREAGVRDPVVLAPYEMQHPPEYELRPSDIRTVSRADLIVFAGYENMVQRLRDAAAGNGPRMLQIVTQYSLAAMRESILKIANAAGTEAAATRNLTEIEAFISDWRQDLAAAGLEGAPVLAHFHQRPLVNELGMRIVGVFGPAPLEATEIAELSATGAVLIVDNSHNRVAAPLAETMPEAVVVDFVNFPQSRRQGRLQDVLAENRSRLDDALRQ